MINIKELFFLIVLLSVNNLECFSQNKQEKQTVIYGSNLQAGKYADIKGARLYYETYGTGLPLLLIHGGYKSIIDFKDNIPILAQHFKVIAVDSRGYGRSSSTLDSMSYELLTDDMAQFLTYLNLDSVYVCGFSDGGIVALYLAAKYPVMVKKVFASGANYLVTGLNQNKSDNTLNTEKVNNSVFWNSIKNQYIQLNPNPEKFDRHIQLIRRMWNHNPCIPKKILTKIVVPVFLLYGDRDIIPLEQGLAIYRLLPGKTTQLCILPNTTHYTFSEKANLVNDLLISFF
jgi:pimeloyl-ACP methyl ester carboxylesterase